MVSQCNLIRSQITPKKIVNRFLRWPTSEHAASIGRNVKRSPKFAPPCTVPIKVIKLPYIYMNKAVNWPNLFN